MPPMALAFPTPTGTAPVIAQIPAFVAWVLATVPLRERKYHWLLPDSTTSKTS